MSSFSNLKLVLLENEDDEKGGTKVDITLGTWNPGKVEWMSRGLAGTGLPIRRLKEGEVPEAEETGSSCEENALIKALAVAKHADGSTIVAAEDSGLFIEALDGFPGVRTARFAPGSDDDRSRLLLERLKGVPMERRHAVFVSAVALKMPGGSGKVYRGELRGRIAMEPVGDKSEGYDRIFLLPTGISLASLPLEVGEARDHRRKALALASEGILSWLDEQ